MLRAIATIPTGNSSNVFLMSATPLFELREASHYRRIAIADPVAPIAAGRTHGGRPWQYPGPLLSENQPLQRTNSDAIA